MGGPKLEVFKFGLCLFFPIGLMYYSGLPRFYETQVAPMEFKWVDRDQVLKSVPKNREEEKEYMEKLIEYHRKLKVDKV